MLVLNHNLKLHRADDLGAYPHFVSQEHRVALSKFKYILWVQHPVTGVTWPWLVDEFEQNYLSKIDKGIETLTDGERQRGLEMGILLDANTVLDQRAVFVNALRNCRKQIAEDGYCLIPSLTFPTYSATVNYYMRHIDANLVFDNQVIGRRSMHNAALFAAVHAQIATLVQSVADEAIKPSYCYLSVYPQGSELVKHTDRAQCKWNASIAFARTADLWPIYVEVPSGVKEIRAELGEVVVYRGTDIPHWREPLPAGTATVCFFHFVNQPYQGTLR